MRALPPAKKRNNKRRFVERKHFPRHPISQYICSPKNNTCEPADSLLAHFELEFQKKYSKFAGGDRTPSDRIALSMAWLFHAVYEKGYLWYPRDRWRTAWQITMRVARRALGQSADAYKGRLYRSVRYLRNPSSEHEAMK